MSRPASAPRPGVKKQLPLKLPPDVEIDLHVFCELHYDAPRTRVIAEALATFIADRRAKDAVLDAEFVEARARFMEQYAREPATLKLLKRKSRLRSIDQLNASKKPG